MTITRYYDGVNTTIRKYNDESEIYTERKSLASFLIFVYKSMSQKRFRIEQLCPSSDNMISLVFVDYAIT